jgi:chromosome segregation ATPase
VLGAEGEAAVPVYVQALLEQTAENMENLQRILASGEEDRKEANKALVALTERLATLTDTMRTTHQLMLRLGETQQALAPTLQRLAELHSAAMFDEVARGHLRNIELHLQRLITESERGRTQATADLRNDIRVLTRTIAALAEEPRQ